MDIGIKLRATFKNDVFYKARLALGYENFADFVKAYNEENSPIAYNTLLGYENLTKQPSVLTAKKVADFLKVPLDILFPTILKTTVKKLKHINKKLYLVAESEKLLSGYRDAESFLETDLKDQVSKSLKNLPEREQVILKLRFFENKTLEQIGQKFGLTRDQIRQIESRGLRRLRHPNNCANLKELVFDK